MQRARQATINADSALTNALTITGLGLAGIALTFLIPGLKSKK
jgi:hypothetical protein